MSELTPCNFCSLRDIRRDAKKRNATVTVEDDTGEMRGWKVVRVSDKSEPVAWFMALTDHCVC